MAKAKQEKTCEETLKSKVYENHTHTCSGMHETFADHFCPECGIWWAKKSRN